ncbi:YkvI family membrane protein [Marilutibacter penaei]|uniref:YkvI family membrane protein n=1 Tax=Marilutibacter penaei TaxID=2759900 RepID=UPI001C72913B|nr:hypothetical protein [Lysobacter penaei]
MSQGSSRFQRYLLPGLAFKSVVIGGGYATGRELAEFFLPGGPRGGLLGIALAMLVWSAVCAATFALAHAGRAFDYRSFFQRLLGPGWVAFEVAYLLFMVLILAVFGAAAGAIGQAVLGWPLWVGTVLLMLGIAVFSGLGGPMVERLFKWASVFLYAVFALFLVFSLDAFGDRIARAFAGPGPTGAWALDGLTYAGYNVVAAVIVLPLARHFTRRRDALVAGALAGPLAMLPALLFFVCMVGWYPAVGAEALPSDFLLRRLDRPWFHLVFQAMVFVALLESGVGAVHAVNERIVAGWTLRRRGPAPAWLRPAVAVIVLVGSMLVADRVGLVALIAKGYSALAWVFLGLYVLPVLTYGAWWLWRNPAVGDPGPPHRPASAHPESTRG